MHWVIWLSIMAVVYWLVWNIYTKVIKNEGEKLFLKEKIQNKFFDRIDY